MRENYRNSIASIKKFPQFTTMNVIDGQAGLVIYASLIFYSLTVDNILNIIVILAGISIQMLTGDNGIIKRAGEAKETTDIAEIKERINLKMAEALINYYTPSSNPAEDNKTDIIKKIVTDLANEYTDGDITGKEKENDDYKIAIEGDGEGARIFITSNKQPNLKISGIMQNNGTIMWGKKPVIELYNKGKISPYAGDFIQLPNQGKYSCGWVKKNTDNIQMHRKTSTAIAGSGDYNANTCFSTKMIDLTGYTRVVFKFSTLKISSADYSNNRSTTFSMILTTNITGNNAAWNNRKKQHNLVSPDIYKAVLDAPGTYILDITGFDSNAYIGMIDRGSHWSNQGTDAVCTSISIE